MQRKLSIIIPVFNEGRYIGQLLKKIDLVNLKSIGFDKEIIVIDDGSTDNTKDVIKKFTDVIYIYKNNGGKGSAVAAGMKKSTGDYIIVQDGDLEYDPNDYIKLLAPLNSGQRVVYGSRILGEIEKNPKSLFAGKIKKQSLLNWFANKLLSVAFYIFFGKYLTDTLTGYKVYPSEAIKGINIETQGFETDHELTAKILRRRLEIIEVPISYYPRGKSEGKKIRGRDFAIALLTITKYRFIS